MIPNDIPGHELVIKGLSDLAAETLSNEALLVTIAATKLRNFGIHVPESPPLDHDPEIVLYLSLCKTRNNGAHSAYNALIRQIVSFARAFPIHQRQLAQPKGMPLGA